MKIKNKLFLFLNRDNYMKKSTSMTKDGSNLGKSRFGCFFCRTLVNFKKPDNSFVEHMGNVWFVNKLNKYCV